MKDVLHNPMFYYIVIPLCVAVWPAAVWTKYLPEAKEDVAEWSEWKIEAEDLMVQILERDPSRLELGGENGDKDIFSYGSAVDRIARLCSIPTRDCDYDAQPKIGGRNGKPATQTANIDITGVGVEQVANFVWKIRLMYPGLECTRIELKHKKGEKDVWDADLKFIYEF